MQEQVALLQELEEQRMKLEQVLLEAQQEREHLKAAVQARKHEAQCSHLRAPLQGPPVVTFGSASASEVSSYSLSACLPIASHCPTHC